MRSQILDSEADAQDVFPTVDALKGNTLSFAYRGLARRPPAKLY
jgi:hypothetical protein